MQRTDFSKSLQLTLPPPATATFDFSTPHGILIKIPVGSTWQVPSHFHSPDQENCLLLNTESGESWVEFHKEPRTGGVDMGTVTFKFWPGYWTSWGRDKKCTKDTVVRLAVKSDALQRNICGSILDADKYPHLKTTPSWLRWVFALLKVWPAAKSWLVKKLCYIQSQVIYKHHGHWEYHGGINTLSWWQATHPFDIGDHPEWTVKVQFKSQRVFSRIIQGFYYHLGTWCLGMRGDYPEYNPHFGEGIESKKQ